MNWILAGASGCGKTTVGRELARRIGAEFLDADDLHPDANIEKMRRKQPLDDADRADWLTAVGRAIARREGPLVVACSALKRRYRDRIRDLADAPLCFVLLDPDRSVLAKRLESRADQHFMPASLLDSQLGTLERSDDFDVIVRTTGTVDATVDEILSGG